MMNFTRFNNDNVGDDIFGVFINSNERFSVFNYTDFNLDQHPILYHIHEAAITGCPSFHDMSGVPTFPFEVPVSATMAYRGHFQIPIQDLVRQIKTNVVDTEAVSYTHLTLPTKA